LKIWYTLEIWYNFENVGMILKIGYDLTKIKNNLKRVGREEEGDL
jgi:hypothetical protein